MGDPERTKEEKKMGNEKKEWVFDPNDLIAKTQNKKEWFSKTVFGRIVEKAKKGDVEAVRWLVEQGYMTVRKGN